MGVCLERAYRAVVEDRTSSATRPIAHSRCAAPTPVCAWREIDHPEASRIRGRGTGAGRVAPLAGWHVAPSRRGLESLMACPRVAWRARSVAPGAPCFVHRAASPTPLGITFVSASSRRTVTTSNAGLGNGSARRLEVRRRRTYGRNTGAQESASTRKRDEFDSPFRHGNRARAHSCAARHPRYLHHPSIRIRRGGGTSVASRRATSRRGWICRSGIARPLAAPSTRPHSSHRRGVIRAAEPLRPPRRSTPPDGRLSS